jgi:hypothetical protein
VNTDADAAVAAVVLAVLVPTVIALRLLRTVERLAGVKPWTLRKGHSDGPETTPSGSE